MVLLREVYFFSSSALFSPSISMKKFSKAWSFFCFLYSFLSFAIRTISSLK